MTQPEADTASGRTTNLAAAWRGAHRDAVGGSRHPLAATQGGPLTDCQQNQQVLPVYRSNLYVYCSPVLSRLSIFTPPSALSSIWSCKVSFVLRHFHVGALVNS